MPAYHYFRPAPQIGSSFPFSIIHSILCCLSCFVHFGKTLIIKQTLLDEKSVEVYLQWTRIDCKTANAEQK